MAHPPLGQYMGRFLLTTLRQHRFQKLIDLLKRIACNMGDPFGNYSEKFCIALNRARGFLQPEDIALEVKGGGARYIGKQAAKDIVIAAGHGTFSLSQKAVEAGVAGRSTAGVITSLKRVP